MVILAWHDKQLFTSFLDAVAKLTVFERMDSRKLSSVS